MAVITLTQISAISGNWLDAFLGRAPQPQIKKKKKRNKGYVHRFHITHRCTAGHNGPGRKTKRVKNAGVTSLHENRLGAK